MEPRPLLLVKSNRFFFGIDEEKRAETLPRGFTEAVSTDSTDRVISRWPARNLHDVICVCFKSAVKRKRGSLSPVQMAMQIIVTSWRGCWMFPWMAIKDGGDPSVLVYFSFCLNVNSTLISHQSVDFQWRSLSILGSRSQDKRGPKWGNSAGRQGAPFRDEAGELRHPGGHLFLPQGLFRACPGVTFVPPLGSSWKESEEVAERASLLMLPPSPGEEDKYGSMDDARRRGSDSSKWAPEQMKPGHRLGKGPGLPQGIASSHLHYNRGVKIASNPPSRCEHTPHTPEFT